MSVRGAPPAGMAAPTLITMTMIPLDPNVLQVGRPIPVSLRDASGHLLLPRGALLADERQREQLLARGVYMTVADTEQFRKALAGKVDTMVRRNALLGQIAKALPDAPDCAAPGRPQRTADPANAWSSVVLRSSALLRDPPPGEFESRVERLEREAMDLLAADADVSLLALIHATAHELHGYSATHAVLVMTVCDLAARHLSWPANWRPALRRAALPMNVAMTALQDQLARQESPLTPRQREAIDGHPLCGAELMRTLGVTDELWLQAVEHHHASVPGPLAGLQASQQLARLIQRADMFAARLAPRRMRDAMAATAAAKAAYLDENRQADEAGSAIIKAVGIYPPGSLVRLASQEVAVVLRRGRRANEPLVASVMSRSGTPLGEPVLRDTRQKPHEVTAGVAPHEVKLRLHLSRLLQLM